jgi:hypothetical protein
VMEGSRSSSTSTLPDLYDYLSDVEGVLRAYQ